MQGFTRWTLLFASSFFQLSVQGTFALLIFNKKMVWKKLLSFVLINIVANEIPRLILPPTAGVLFIVIYFVVLILSLRLVLGFRYIQSFLAAFILFLLSALIEYVAIAILKVSLHGFDLYAWMGASFYNPLILRNMGTILNLFAVLVIYYMRININLPKDIYRQRAFSIIINVFLSAAFIIPNLLFFQSSAASIPVGLFIFNAVAVFIILILSTYNSIKHSELEIKRQEVEFQKIYIDTLNDLIDNLRGFKHELNNIFSVIGGYLTLGDLDGLKRYYRQIYHEVKVINNASPLNAYIKDIPALYGLILAKISYCEIRDVQFEIIVFSSIETGGMKTFDFCKIIGIFLDNAIEAAAESEKKYVKMSILRNEEKSCEIIEIINSFTGEVPVDKIFNKDFTTKTNHSGFGLWEVKRILAKYKNFKLKTDIHNEYFIQKLEIFY